MKLMNQLAAAILSLTMTVTVCAGLQTVKASEEMRQNQFMHISFDDVYSCLYDITVNEYQSVFENAMLSDLKNLHDEYGAVFTLNCFVTSTKQTDYDISKLPSRYRAELANCTDWLKFAFHAENDQKKYDDNCAGEISASYKKFADGVINLTGTEKSIDNVVRLGFFTGSDANVEAIRNCENGITGLLTADDDRSSYYFSNTLNKYMIDHGEYYDIDKNLHLIRTQNRLETVRDINAELDKLAAYQGTILEIFTHESEYDKVKTRLEAYVQWAAQNGYRFDFAENHIPELIAIKEKTAADGYITYRLKINTGGSEEAKLICAVYNGDETLEAVEIRELSNEMEFTAQENKNGRAVFMVWESMRSMIPIAKAVSSTTAAEITPIPPSEKSAVTLNKTNYPLVVGNKSKTDFSDWESRGSTVQLSAEVNHGTYTSRDINWESEDASIATVSSTGKVQGRTTGVTKIYASLPDGDTAVCDISVIDNVTRLTVITLGLNAEELILEKGQSTELIPIINPKDVFDNGVLDKSLTWSSSDTNTAVVSNGIVTAVNNGTAVITAVSNDIGRKTVCTVTVTDKINTTGVSTSIEMPVSIKVGETAQLAANIEGADSELIWKSDNTYIADVDENGVVTAYSNSNTPRVGKDGTVVFEKGKAVYDAGTVDIIATTKDGGYSIRVPIRVTEAKMQAQSVAVHAKSLNMARGDVNTITAAILPANMLEKKVVWSSSDETVVTVADSGRTVYGLCKADVTAAGTGTAVITAECDGKIDTCTVTVTDGVVMVDNINITNEKVLDIEEVYQLKAEVTDNATNQELAWISTDRTIVTVNNEGVLKGYRVGTVKIYAIAMDSIENMELLDQIAAARTVGGSNPQMEALLRTAVYAECEITVADSSPYLRNLHIPEETITDNSATLLWNRASLLDTNNCSTYEVYCNGIKIDTVTMLGYTVKHLQPDTTYQIEVAAVDNDANELMRERVTVKTKVLSPVINVLDYGAKGNGRVMDTHAIQNAINACPEGGTVLLPRGCVFYSGALFLKSNMTFRVDGILMGSPDSKDYPMVVSRWEGWRKLYQPEEEWENTTAELPENHHPYASLINAGTYDEGKNSHTGPYNIENIVICGEGQINGNGFRTGYNEGLNQKTGNGGWPEPMTPAMDQTVRGRTITFHNAKNVYIKDVTAAYGPAWTVHAIYSDSMTFDGMSIVSKGDGETGAADNICILNGDGINPDSSTNINIFNVHFRAGDDAVAIKTGRNKEGNILDKPSAYIRITDCVSDGSKDGFVAGSENAAGIHDVLFQNLSVKNITLSHSIWLKTYWSRGGVSEDLIFRDIDSSKRIDIAANYATSTNNPADEMPVYRYMTFENCNTPFVFEGLKSEGGRPASYIQNILIRGCKGSGSIDYGQDFEIWDTDSSKWKIAGNSSGINFYTTGQFEDVEIKLSALPKRVRTIDTDKHSITVIRGTTGSHVLEEIDSVVKSGTQIYSFYSQDGTVMENSAVLTDACILCVTAQDGIHSAEYRVITELSDLIYDDTQIQIAENAVSLAALKGSYLYVRDGVTSEDAQTELRSEMGLEQSYRFEDKDGNLPERSLQDGDILIVTSPNGKQTRCYTIIKVQTWDFRNAVNTKTDMGTFENNTTVYHGVTISGGSEGDYLAPETGLYYRGKSAVGNAPMRFVAFIAKTDGILSVTAKYSFSSGELYSTTSSDLRGGSVIPGLSKNADWKTGEITVKKDNTYYLYCVGSGMQIGALLFFSDEPVNDDTAEPPVSKEITWDLKLVLTEPGENYSQSRFNCQSDAEQGSYRYHGLTITGRAGDTNTSDGIKESGIFYNGKCGTNNGVNYRYITYTPETDGTLTVYGKGTSGSSKAYASTSFGSTGNASLFSGTSSASGSIAVKGGQTYYIYPIGAGMHFEKIVFRAVS